MRDTLNNLLSSPLDVCWKVLTVLTFVSMAEMLRGLLRRVRRLQP